MREGLFWVICSMTENGIDRNESWELYPYFVPSDAISHKEAWTKHIQPKEKHFRRYAYNFYPRGRVVIRNGKATVFLNRHIVTEEVIAKICKTFSLDNPKIHVEGGTHYECYTDKMKGRSF